PHVVPAVGARHTHPPGLVPAPVAPEDRKSTRLNSSHVESSYAVFCLKKKKAGTDHSGFFFGLRAQRTRGRSTMAGTYRRVSLLALAAKEPGGWFTLSASVFFK